MWIHPIIDQEVPLKKTDDLKWEDEIKRGLCISQRTVYKKTIFWNLEIISIL